jgi:ankyrin repeat protein
VQELLNAGANIDVKDSTSEENDAFSLAAKAGHRGILKMLIAQEGERSVLLAMKRDTTPDIAFVKTLIAAGANVNAQDKSGDSPIHQAVHWERDTERGSVAAESDVNRSESLLDVLIAAGADVNTRDIFGSTALIAKLLGAGTLKFQEANAKYSFERNDINDKSMKFTALVKLRIEAGADVNASNSIGDTALSVAQADGLDEIVSLLKKKGARELSKEERLVRTLKSAERKTEN